MANKTIVDLPAATAAALTQVLEIVNDPAGTPASQKLTLTQIKTLLDTLYVIVTRTISAGTGLTGGGDLSANRTLALSVPVTVTNGGTGLTTVPANQLLYGNGSGALLSNANFTFVPATSDLILAGQMQITGDTGLNNGLLILRDDINGICYQSVFCNTSFALFGLTEATGRGFFQASGNGIEIQAPGGALGNFGAQCVGSGVFNDGSVAQLFVENGAITRIFALNNGDDLSTPTNATTPAGYQHVMIDGFDAWIPYFT
jgi:hypothetical protein